MKNFIITLIIYRACKLYIKPLEWFILPAWKEDSSLGNGSKWIIVKYPYDEHHPTGLTSSTNNFRIAYRSGIIISWLCFTLQFTKWKYVEELRSIYGVDYDYTGDLEWREKYERLCKTDYFN